MAELTGNPVTVTLPTAQYLFRLYHSPITLADTSRLKGSVDANGYVFKPAQSGFEVNYNDHLLSVLNTTEELVEAANALAYAEALLYVNSRIYFIAVWMVEEGEPITKGSPTLVLTPWHTKPDSYSQVEMLEYREWPLDPNPVPAINLHPMFYQLGHDEGNFQSYDLINGTVEGYIKDPFIVLEIARDVDLGHFSKQWYKGVLGVDDYYFDDDNVCCLLPFANGVQTRFTWYQATLETMRHTHSGFVLNPDGSIKRGRIAYTKRIANLAIDASQQRREFCLRSYTTQRVMQCWWDVCRYVSHALRWQEIAGYPEYRNLDYGPYYQHQNYPYALCPTLMAQRICSAVAFFLNVVAVASGSNVVASYAPHWQNYSQEEVFRDAAVYLGFQLIDGTWQGEIVPELEESISYETFGALQDLVGAVWEKMWTYTRAGTYRADGAIQFNPHTNAVTSLFSVVMHNYWAMHYEGTQGHLQAMFSLLFTWQFQYKPYEPKRNPQQNDAYKTIVKTGKVYAEKNKRFWDFYNNVKQPPLDGRILEEMPRFAPWRTWQVEIPMPDAETQYQAALKQEEIDKYNAKLLAQKLAREARAAQRKARYEAERTRLLAEIAAGKRRRPLDVHHHENWTDPDWWLEPIHEDDVPEFIANALDTPSEIDVASDVFNLSPRVRNGLKRLEPAIDTVKDVVYPHRVLRRGIKHTLVRRVVINGKTKYKQHALDEVKDDMKSRVYDAIRQDENHQVERDFWPDGDDAPTPEKPPYNPFVSSSDDTGGGGSGGGGGGATW